MKNIFFPAILAGLIITGCSSAYKTGQTPDDVYYSAPTERAAVARNTQAAQAQSDDGYQSYFANPDDAYLRMKVQNNSKWSSIDDLDYWYGYNSNYMFNPYFNNYNPYNSWNTWNYGFGHYGSSFGWNPWMNSGMFFGAGYYGYSGWNSWNNPWYWSRPVVIIGGGKNRPVYGSYRPSLGGYNNNLNAGFQRSNAPRAVNNGGGRGFFRNGLESNSNSGYDRPAPTRTFSSPSSSGSSSGSSGGGSRGSSSGGGAPSRGGRGGR